MENKIVYCVHCNRVARWMFYRGLDILTADSDKPEFEKEGHPVCDECRKNIERILDEETGG